MATRYEARRCGAMGEKKRTTRPVWTIRNLRAAIQQVEEYLRWEAETLEQFHVYARANGAKPGQNVYKFVLEDAKRLREQREEAVR